MMQKTLQALMILFAIIIGLYPAIYCFVDKKFGLLGSKSDGLLNSMVWRPGFYIHIICGGIALLIGWLQFIPKFRNRNIRLHRQIGKAYVISVLLSATTGIGIAFFATGGMIPSSGFVCLGLIWFYTTLMSYLNIRNKQVEQHRKMMVYSYAACFAAVTLRIWLPLLVMGLGNFITAYRVVAWICWVPNILVACLISNRLAANNKVLPKHKF